MIQRFIGLLLLLGLGWILRRLFGAAVAGAGSSPGRRPGPGAGSAAEAMVRDRVCNTFLPARRAMTLSVDGELHHFCSEACRSRFLAERSPRAGAAPTSS